MLTAASASTASPAPDEYSAIADNNVYTNLMAQSNLQAAAGAVERYPERARELGVDPDEAVAWRGAAEAMFVPYDEELGVHPQAEQFTEHAVWDFARTGPDQYPLMLHYHYFDLYRKQVVKQADLVLALYLRGRRATSSTMSPYRSATPRCRRSLRRWSPPKLGIWS